MPSLNLLFTATDNAQPTIRNLIASTADLAMAANGAISVFQNFGRRIASTMEQAFRFQNVTARLAPLVGGLDSARKMSKKLRDEAAHGTQSFESLAATAGKLSSVFQSSQNIEKWTSAFHDLSAGLGRDINELVENFVKAKASGRFEGGFLDMFAQKGVNLFAGLQRETGKTGAELRAMAVSGELSFSQVEKAILKTVSAGGVFENQAAALSSTAGGKISTLAATWQTLQAEFAEPIADGISPIVDKITNSIERLEPVAARAGNFLSKMFDSRANFALGSGVVGALVGTAIGGLPSAGEVSTAHTAVLKISSAIKAIPRIPAMVLASFSALRNTIAGLNAHTLITAARFVGAKIGAVAMATGALAARVAFAGLAVAIRSVKYALISSGIGVAIVAVGEALSWCVEKLEAWFGAAENSTDAARAHADSLEEISNSFRDLSNAADVAQEKEREIHELLKERSRIDADAADAKERYARNSEKMTAVEAAAAKRMKELQIESARRERDAARERAQSAAEKIRAYEDERAAAARSVSEQIEAIEKLEGATAGSMRYFVENIKTKKEMSADEAETVERFVAAVKKIDALESARANASKSIESRIELLKAEIESEEKLAEVKERNYRAEIRSQYIAAGKSAIAADADAAAFIELEKKAEEARSRREREKSASVAIAAEEKELELLRARASGEKELSDALERRQKIAAETARLVSSGVDSETARRLAEERQGLNEAISAASQKSTNAENSVRSARGGATIWKNGRIIEGGATEFGAAATMAAGSTTGGGRVVVGDVFSSFLEIQRAIRENTASAAATLARIASGTGTRAAILA